MRRRCRAGYLGTWRFGSVGRMWNRQAYPKPRAARDPGPPGPVFPAQFGGINDWFTPRRPDGRHPMSDKRDKPADPDPDATVTFTKGIKPPEHDDDATVMMPSKKALEKPADDDATVMMPSRDAL